jgi:AraC-like DNA-binding protein
MAEGVEERAFPSSHALHLVELVKRWGVSGRDLLEGFDRRVEDLSDPNGTLTLQEVVGLVERARVLTREPALGFYFGLQMSASAHGYLGFAAMSAATLQRAIELVVQYAPIRTSILAFRLEVGEGSASITIDELFDLGPARDVVLIGILVGIWQIGNALLGREVRESTVDVTFPEPSYYGRLRDLNPRVRFGQAANRLVFDRTLLEAPLVSSDPASLRLAQEECARQLDLRAARLPVAERVRRLVMRRDVGVPSFEDLAEALHISPRTLRRRLAEARISFSKLLDEARRDRALLLLRSPELSTKDVAERVGYSDVANFMRAFRRWTGRTPAAYRRDSSSSSRH